MFFSVLLFSTLLSTAVSEPLGPLRPVTHVPPRPAYTIPRDMNLSSVVPPAEAQHLSSGSDTLQCKEECIQTCCPKSPPSSGLSQGSPTIPVSPENPGMQDLQSPGKKPDVCSEAGLSSALDHLEHMKRQTHRV